MMLPPDLHFQATQTALIVVDLQVDFCSPQGRSAKSRHAVTDMLRLPGRIERFVRKSSALGVLIVFTKAIVDEQTMPENLKLFRQFVGVNPPVRRGTGGEELCDMHVPPSALIIEKPHFDAFAHTTLSEELQSRGVRNVLICGVRTEICVDATARRASAEEFHTVILRDLVATRDANRDDGERALDFFGRYYGFVLNSSQVPVVGVEVGDRRRGSCPDRGKLEAAMTRVIVTPYDPAWIDKFKHEKEMIIAALVRHNEGPLFRAVEHVGSTAVPGLCAKPCIDILLTLGGTPVPPPLIATLEGLGYAYRGENGISGRHYFTKGPHDYHLHAVTSESQFHKDHLLFRDYLRANPQAALTYGDAKLALAATCRDRDQYQQGKSPLIEELLDQAWNWAATV